jgi:hypothetical protein
MSLSFHPSNFYLLFVSSMIILLVWMLKSRNQKENKWDYVILSFIGASFLFTAPFADSFLNTWDEQFHALIAWRMSHDNSILPYLYPAGWPASLFTNHWWTSTQLWLHKPPLFLWVMSLGFEAFGTHVWSGRIPSLVLAISLIPITYKSLTLINIDRFTAMFTTSLVCYSFILYEWISGRAALDQNDLMVVFFSSASILCYIQSLKHKTYAILWALLMAAGVLTKSLPAYLPLALFLLHSVLSRKIHRTHVFSALLSVLVPATWWIFAGNMQGDQQKKSWNYVLSHLTNSVEGHQGSWTFYFDSLSQMHAWGFLFPLMIIGGALLLVLKGENEIKKSLGVTTLAVLFFYSSVPTKMPGYPLIAFLPMILGIAFLMQHFFSIIHQRFIRVLVILLFIWGSANPMRIVQTHRTDHLATEWTKHKLKEQRLINERLGDDSSSNEQAEVWLNMPKHSNITAMFGRAHIIAVSDSILNPERQDSLLDAGYVIQVW